MAINYTTLLGLAQPVTGTESNVWGDVVNDSITALLDSAIAGTATISLTAGDVTLTDVDGAADQARMAILVLTGTPGTTRNVVAPSQSKTYIVVNQSDSSAVIKGSATTGVTVRAGQAATCVWNGADFEIVASGDVDGPASATNNAIPTFDGTTGKLIKDNSGATISAGVITSTGISTGQVDITAQGDLRLQDTTGGQYVALQAPGTVATSYTLTLPVDDGTAGQALITDGSGVLSWSSAASGDVYGPASATDNAVARYDGTTGKIIQNSAVTIADDGATVIAANSTTDGLRITQTGTGNALLVEDSTNPDATPTVIAADGSVSVGSSVGYTFGASTKPSLQVNGLTSSTSSIGTARWQTGISPSSLVLAKSRSGTVGTQGIVSSGDSIGSVTFDGDDGTAFISAATITAQVDGTPGTNDMPGRLVFSTTADGASSPTERMRIDNAGRVGIGSTSSASSLRVARNLTGAITLYGISVEGTIQSDVTSSYSSVLSFPSTQATAFTLTSLFHFAAVQPAFGAGSAVANQYGFIANNSLTGATNNYGFYSNIASGTGRWNFYAAGTADNYFAGSVGVGATPNGEKLIVVQSVDITSGTTSTAGGGANSGTIKLSNSGTLTQAVGTLVSGISFTGTSSPNRRRGLIASYQSGADADQTGLKFFTYNSAATTSDAVSEFLSIAHDGVTAIGGTVGAESLRVTPVASAVNYLQVQGAITGSPPITTAQGSDTNVSLQYLSKGTGNHNFGTAGGTAQFLITHTASAVNYLQVTGAATGSVPIFRATGSDTNVPLTILTKGTGYINFQTGGGTQFLVANTASAVNYLQVTGNTTGNTPVIAAVGSDTNIDIALTPKGTGNVRFGTLTANADAPITGYIEVKDSAGNVRKLAVIA